MFEKIRDALKNKKNVEISTEQKEKEPEKDEISLLREEVQAQKKRNRKIEVQGSGFNKKGCVSKSSFRSKKQAGINPGRQRENGKFKRNHIFRRRV